ncbi:hypothetical protein ACFY15_27820 [Streptomyces sp. NPDC001373]|uniref:hypothetical protein n=1 Tax=Streptomyces sp. NPDC001373 TaxID=3364565 RepID=UPI0036A992C5
MNTSTRHPRCTNPKGPSRRHSTTSARGSRGVLDAVLVRPGLAAEAGADRTVNLGPGRGRRPPSVPR